MFIKLFNGSTSHLQNIKIITLYKIHQSPELWNQTRKPFKLIFHLSIKMHEATMPTNNDHSSKIKCKNGQVKI